MAHDRHQRIIGAVQAQLAEHLGAIESTCVALREALGAPAHRVWLCPFSSDELLELGGRGVLLFASPSEQLSDGPLTSLTRMRHTEEGQHPRWNYVVRDQIVSGAPLAPFWEVDLCLRDPDREQPERIGVVTFFDPTGHARVPDELGHEAHDAARGMLDQLTEHLAAYRQGRYDLELLTTLERDFTRTLVLARGQPDAVGFFDEVTTWFRGALRPEHAHDPAEPNLDANVAALYIKDENRLVLVDATRDFKLAATLAADAQMDNPLTSVPLDKERNDGSLLSFAYEVMSREHEPLLFPAGRSDGTYISSLLEDLRQRIDQLRDETGGDEPLESLDEDDELPVTPSIARAMLRRFFQRVKHHGSCGFFPLMRREEVEGVLVLFPAQRTFFHSANVLLVQAIADRLCRLPDLLPDHRQDKDYRDRKTRLIYVEQRHQRIDRYLTGGQRVRAVAFLNLDGFRELNDIYGHKVGDRVLESVMEGLVVAAHRPGLLGNRYSALQFVEQEKQKIDAEQYATTELSKTRRSKRLRLLPLHYGGDEFGLVFLGRDEGSEKETVFVCQQVVADLLGFLRFRLAGQVDAGRLRLSAGLALPSRLDNEEEQSRNEFALYSGLRELGDALMYYAKGLPGVSLYCPGHTVVEHRFELVIDEGGPGVWRAALVSSKEVGDRVPMSGDVLHLDLLYSLQRTVGRHVRNGEDREAILRRVKKTMSPVRFEVLYRLPRASGRGAREEYLVRQLDDAGAVNVGVGDQLHGHVQV